MNFDLKIFSKEIKYSLVSIMFVIFQACRDNAFNPNDSYGNVNEPVVISSYNSFVFQLNGKNISRYIVEKINFSRIENQISITVRNYLKGVVSISVTNKDNSLKLFSTDFDKSTLNYDQIVKGDIPDRVIISFTNFSGFFKMNFYAINPY